MKLVPYDATNLEVCKYKKSNNHKLIEEFLSSELTCAEVKEFTHRDSHSCAAALNLCARRFKMLNVRAISRNNRVFLIKEPIN